MAKYSAKELVQVIATVAICLALLVIVGGLMAVILELRDGEQTAAIQNTMVWILVSLVAGLTGVAGLPHIFGGTPQDPGQQPTYTISVPVPTSPAPAPAPVPVAPAAGDPPSGVTA